MIYIFKESFEIGWKLPTPFTPLASIETWRLAERWRHGSRARHRTRTRSIVRSRYFVYRSPRSRIYPMVGRGCCARWFVYTREYARQYADDRGARRRQRVRVPATLRAALVRRETFSRVIAARSARRYGLLTAVRIALCAPTVARAASSLEWSTATGW